MIVIVIIIIIVLAIIIWFGNCLEWLFLLYHLINQTIFFEVQAFQDVIYRSDESRTHIWLFIRIYLYTSAGLFRVTSRPSTFCYLHYIKKTGFRHTRKTVLHHIEKTW